MNNNHKEKYIMESPWENERLSNKIDSIPYVNKYLRNYLNGYSWILDIGCGPCDISKAMAEKLENYKLFLLDKSLNRVIDIKGKISDLKNKSIIAGDANYLPYKSNSFDLVFSRFMMEYIKNPEQVVKEMYRVCRPGGRLFLQDLDGQIIWNYPEDKIMQKQMKDFITFIQNMGGFDPYIGRKLYHYLYISGFKNIHVEIEPYHVYAGSISNETLRYWDFKIEVLLPYLTQFLGDQKKADKLKNDYLSYLKREDTLT